MGMDELQPPQLQPARGELQTLLCQRMLNLSYSDVTKTVVFKQEIVPFVKYLYPSLLQVGKKLP